jgi:hypothetical protein
MPIQQILPSFALAVALVAGASASAQPTPAPVPYTQPVPWVPRAYPPMSQPWMKIDPGLQWPSPPPVAPYQRPTPYRMQPPATP